MTEVPQDEVELNLLKTGLGSVTQSDVEAAALAEASIFAFNVGTVPPDVKVGDPGLLRFDSVCRASLAAWCSACACAMCDLGVGKRSGDRVWYIFGSLTAVLLLLHS